MITTSRAALRLRAERRYQVAPLALPANADAQAIDTAPAVALFVERAEAVEWGFQLSNQTRNDVWAICARLDGLPLAIELAAARADQFTPADLLAHLARRLAVLHDGPRDLPTRQQTLRAAIHWSYDLLTAREQAHFAALSVFTGSFDSDAAAALGVAKLEPLIHASLLQRRTNAEGQPRFALLETLREFALEQLSPERQAALYQAHATYFAVRAEREQAKQHDQAQWFQQVDADIENYRAAADWSLAHDGGKAGARIIAALRMYFSTRGLLEISNQWATLLHDQPEAFDLQPALHACAAHAIGFLRSQHSDTSGRSLALIQRASRLAVEVGDTTTAVQGLIALGMLARYPGNSANVLAALNRARDLAEASEEPHLLAQVYVQIGMALLEWGRYNDARLAFERVLEYARLAGLELRALRSLPDLAETYLRQHQHTQAMAHYTHALTWARSVGDREVVAEAEYGLGLLATLAGNLDQADALFTQSLVVYREIGLAYVSRATYVSGYVALVRGQAERAIRKGCGVRLIHFWSRLRPTRLLGWPLSMHGQAVLHRRLRDVVRLMGFASASVAARTSSSQPCEPCSTRHQRYALPTPSLTPQ